MPKTATSKIKVAMEAMTSSGRDSSPRSRTLLECLERAERSPDGVTFVMGENETFVPYRLLATRARQVAFGLRAAGVASGDVVGIAVPTSPEFYEAFLGAVCAGAAPASLPLPPRFGDRSGYDRQRDAMLRASGARELITLERLRTLTATKEELDPSPVASDSLALVQYSSGTTSEPKAIPLTHRQLLANVHVLLDQFLEPFPEGDGFRHVGVSWLPLYHDMGLVGAMLVALAHPGPLVLLRPEAFIARPASWLRAISRVRGTVSAAPNFAYDLCVDRIRDDELEGVDLSCWLLALNGSEVVSAQTLERFYRRFAPYGLRQEALTPVYGLGEVALGVTFSDPRRAPLARERDGRRYVSCGPPLPGYDVRIHDGRVLVRGPSLMCGYLGGADLCDGALRDGWLDTGDLGFLEEGELHLIGRSKEILIVRGRNLAPQVVEEALSSVPGVELACAVAERNDHGEKLVVLAESRESALEAPINARLSQALGLVADRVVIVKPGALPRTTSGKLKRAEAARRFL